MEYNRDLFIFGEPVETSLGTVRFLTYKEFLLNQSQLSLIGLNILHIYYYFVNQIPKHEKDKLEQLKPIKEIPLWQYVKEDSQFENVYRMVFGLLIDFTEGFSVDDIMNDQEIFMSTRKLIMDMNVITEEEVSPNEEIQKAIERSRRVKQTDSEKQSFVDIITCIVAQTPNDFEKVNKMNVMQVYALYARLNAIHNYKTSTLFATVAEKVTIELWNKHINLFESKSDTLTKTEFDKGFGGLLK